MHRVQILSQTTPFQQLPLQAATGVAAPAVWRPLSGIPVTRAAGPKLVTAAVCALSLLTGCDVRPDASGSVAPDPGTGSVRAPSGWTSLQPSNGSRHVYVSSSSGNDNNSGLSEQSPKASIQAGVALLRQGTPDWLHIKRGDRFAGGLGDWYLSGRSAAEPMVVTTYGTSNDRPLFRCGTGFGLTVHAAAIHDVAFVGLHFFADTYDGANGQPYGVSLLQPCTGVLIEDCMIDRFFNNVRFQGSHNGLKLRRSVIADAYATGTAHAEGIYVDGVSDCLIEECVFDHNGWLAGVPGAVADIYRHNIYIQGNTSNVVIRGNIIARGGSHGLQARSGGEVRDNLFLGNAINLLVGDNILNNGAVTATVIGNVMLDGRDISGSEPRGWAAMFQCLASGEIAGNVAAHQLTGTNPVSFQLDSTLGVGIRNVNFHDNIAYKWGAPLSLAGAQFSGLTLRANDVQEYGGGQVFGYAGTLPGLTSAGNRFYTSASAAQWMFYAGQAMSLATWKSMVGDSTSAATQPSYARPEEQIADYDAATGGSGGLDSFLSRARGQSRTTWSELLVGTNVAAHFRANFVAGTPPPPPPPPSAGWTSLTPSSSTRHVYVSSSGGNDGNSGLAEQSPKATIQAAVALLRPGSPDWLHVKSGDQFAGGLGDWALSGRSATEPMVVTTYGTSPTRPLFRCGTGFGLTVHFAGIHDVAFVGMHFLADTYDGSNGQPYGVSLLQPCTNVLLEDCMIDRFFVNLRIQGTHAGVKLRRNVIADAYTTGSAHAEGIYVDGGVDDFLIEECLFDHNGWLAGVPGAVADIYRHNIYIQGNTTNVVIRGNIIARGGSHGLQARSGGEVRNNLFLGNAINLLVGNNILNNGAVTATVIGNVMLDGRDISSTERRGWAAMFQCLTSAEIANNVAAHQVTGTGPVSFDLDSSIGVGINNVTFHNNIAYKWGAPLQLVNSHFSALAIRNNDVQEFNGGLVFHYDSGTIPGLASSGNRFFSSASTGQWMFYAGQSMSLPTWRSMVNDSTSTAAQVGYPHPEEKIADYDAATGGVGGLDSFLTRARSQSRTAWNPQLAGTNVAAHFRANFGVSP